MTDEPASSDDERESGPPAEQPEGAEQPQGGVFGNLPHTRPGSRSPRRRAGAAVGSEPGPDPAARAEAKATPKPRADSAPEPDEIPDASDDEQAGGIEDLAWAGVAAAAEAATLGVRLANRALGAMRDTIERR
jgi:hypothetical protein